MQLGEQEPIAGADHRSKSYEPKKVRAAGGEEGERSHRPSPRQPVQNSTRQENPQADVAGHDGGDGRIERLGVGEAAERRERASKSEDFVRERTRSRGGLEAELAGPDVIPLEFRATGFEARTEMTLEFVLEGHAERQRCEERRCENPDRQKRGAEHATPAFEKRPEDRRARPGVGAGGVKRRRHRS